MIAEAMTCSYPSAMLQAVAAGARSSADGPSPVCIPADFLDDLGHLLVRPISSAAKIVGGQYLKEWITARS